MANDLDLDAAQLARRLATIAVEHKAEAPTLLQMEGVADVTDVFVLLTALNRQHVHALVDHIRDGMRKQLGLKPVGVEGESAARWVCMDYGTVWAHIFTEDLREYYDLEGLWKDARRLPLEDEPAPAPNALVS